MDSPPATATTNGRSGPGSGSGSSSSSTSTARRRKSSSLTPPYWQHQRVHSFQSQRSVHAAPITLEDHTEAPSDQSGALWARSVNIDDYVIVSGGSTGVGAYVVYNCTVETLDGGPMIIRKRYSEFDELRRKLRQTFPMSRAAMPELPPKSAIWRTQPKFLEKRRLGLNYFLNCVLLNPEFSGSPVLKEFVFS